MAVDPDMKCVSFLAVATSITMWDGTGGERIAIVNVKDRPTQFSTALSNTTQCRGTRPYYPWPCLATYMTSTLESITITKLGRTD